VAESRENKKINFVYEISNKPTKVEKKNKACYFVIPLLGYSISYFTALINCYVGDNTNKPDLTFKNVFVHVKYYDEKLLRIKYFNQYYRLEDDTYIYVFNIPKQFHDDYIKFCDGKYSKISKEGKDLICEKSGIRPVVDSLVYKVLYKTNDQRELIEELIGEKLKEEYEIYSKPNFEREIYNGNLKIYTTDILKFEKDIDEE
jgi:hypothetical protein